MSSTTNVKPALRVAILVVSTTASKDPATDKVEATLRDVFETEARNAFTVAEAKIVPDEKHAIEEYIIQWAAGKPATADSKQNGTRRVNLVVTSGGTGFAPNDITPEVIRPLIDREAPGLVHKMLSESLQITPFAAVARPVAGVRNQTLIVTLPGSPKGAKENLLAILKLLSHICAQLADGDTRSMHAGGTDKLEKDAGFSSTSEKKKISTGHDHEHHHHHNHGHGGHHIPKPHTDQSNQPQSNDPLLGPSRRARASPYPIISVTDALNLIAENVPSPEAIKEQFKLDLVSHVLAADVTAKEAVPAFRASLVDGYAIRIRHGDYKSQKGVFKVAFASHAVAGDIPVLPEGQISRITTGAPLPDGANAVVMVEDTKLSKMTDDGKDEDEVEILTDEVKLGENIREVGSDVSLNSVVMKKGEGITAFGGELGLLASVGARVVEIYKKPTIGVMSTGDEIIPIESKGVLGLGAVRDSNRPSLLSAIKSYGFKSKDFGIISDKPATLESSMREALINCDVLITTGGVSMGEFDLLKPTIERGLGGKIHFGRVAMKPGKPTTFATVPGANIKNPQTGERMKQDKVIFSLPGNPASAIVTFLLFVLPAINQMSSITPLGLPQVSVKLAQNVSCDPQREEYHRAVVSVRSGQGAGLVALSTGGQRSSRVGSFKAANALLKLPAGGGLIKEGAMIQALLMGPIGTTADGSQS